MNGKKVTLTHRSRIPGMKHIHLPPAAWKKGLSTKLTDPNFFVVCPMGWITCPEVRMLPRYMRGALIDLLCVIWSRGVVSGSYDLPDDDSYLMAVLSCNLDELIVIKKWLFGYGKFFVPRHGVWVSKAFGRLMQETIVAMARMRYEREKARREHRKRLTAARVRHYEKKRIEPDNPPVPEQSGSGEGS